MNDWQEDATKKEEDALDEMIPEASETSEDNEGEDSITPGIEPEEKEREEQAPLADDEEKGVSDAWVPQPEEESSEEATEEE